MALGLIAMWFYPLKRGVHERIVAELWERTGGTRTALPVAQP